jgi:hypothetical protein
VEVPGFPYGWIDGVYVVSPIRIISIIGNEDEIIKVRSGQLSTDEF